MNEFRVKSDYFRFALQESFVSLLPYLLLSSTLILLNQIVTIYKIDIPYISHDSLYQITHITQNMYPLLLTMSVSYNMSNYFEVDRIIGSGLAMVVFLVDSTFMRGADPLAIANGGIDVSLISLVSLTSLVSLISPIMTLAIFSIVARPSLQSVRQASLSPNLIQALNLLLPFIVSFSGSLVVLRILHWAATHAGQALDFGFLDGLQFLGLMVWMFVTHVVWFLGLHGTNIMSFVFGQPFFSDEIVPNLSRIAYIELFVGFGGVGSSLALVLAILIVSRDRHMRFVALTGAPLVFFNITEVIIFGVPVIFNLHLLVPFILVPMMNFVISYMAVTHGLFVFKPATIGWITPMGLNAYLRTGSFQAPMFQVFQLALSTLVYMPFVRRFSRSQSTSELRSLLGERLRLVDRLKNDHGLNYYRAQSFILRSHRRTREAIDIVSSNELAIHYQPKIGAQTCECVGFEALLRLKMRDGKIIGPTFLETLESAGFARLVDQWVCTQVLRELSAFEAIAPGLRISINLHPDSLADNEFVAWLLIAFWDRNVDFEIIERGFCDLPLVSPNIMRMHQAGLSLSVDDFGTGYCNLSTLTSLPVDTIKLDKSLLDGTENSAGSNLYVMITKLCSELGYKVLAEGVETKEQLDRVQAYGVDQVQGWYFAKAMPLKEALIYAKHH